MRELHSKQRAFLRGLANSLDTLLHIGKEGITDNLKQQADELLEAKELIKGVCLETAPQTAREACDLLAEALGAQPVQCIGRRFVLYRPKKKDPVIVLPSVRKGRQ